MRSDHTIATLSISYQDKDSGIYKKFIQEWEDEYGWSKEDYIENIKHYYAFDGHSDVKVEVLKYEEVK